MRACGYSKHGPAAVQEVFSNLPLPEIGNVATGLRIKVHAASFNPIDFKRRSGELKLFAPERKWPVVLGYDCSGTVESVGSGVTKFKVGDAVYARVNGIPQYPGCGTCAEYTLATEAVAAPKPANMSWEEAAAVPLAAMTAVQMLRKAGMKAGDAVFVTAGAGGVGHFAIQIAKAMGASRVVASASAAKHALLKELGADEVIDYRTQDYTQVFTDRPFDIALDNVAEVTKLCKIVKRGGWVVSNVQGFTGQTLEEATGNKVNFLLRGVLYLMRFGVERAAAQAGVSVNGMFLKPNSDDLRFLTGLIEANKVKAVVNVFEGFDKAADAMAMLEGGRTTGKVVVKIAP